MKRYDFDQKNHRETKSNEVKFFFLVVYCDKNGGGELLLLKECV